MDTEQNEKDIGVEMERMSNVFAWVSPIMAGIGGCTLYAGGAMENYYIGGIGGAMLMVGLGLMFAMTYIDRKIDKMKVLK